MFSIAATQSDVSRESRPAAMAGQADRISERLQDSMARNSFGRTWIVRIVFCLSLAGLLGGCRSAEPIDIRPLPPSIRLAVLDFSVPRSWHETENPGELKKEMRGWWFGSRDIWHNPGLGRMAADVYSHELNKEPFINVVSRVDIKYYMARKREQLRRLREQQSRDLEATGNPEDLKAAARIRQMTDAEYTMELQNLPPREIGRELKADRVLVGRIRDSYLAHNRTINWYWTYVDLELDLYDVDSGNVVWHKRWQTKKSFASALYVLEDSAAQVIDMMKNEYFYPPAP